jgi:hypothetical protein
MSSKAKTADEKPSSFWEWVRGNDMYASPITLTFNKKPKFTTVQGGLCSLFSFAIIILYFSLKFITMIDQTQLTKSDVITYNTWSRNETTDRYQVEGGFLGDI